MELIVGPEKVTFIVHKEILCDASPFFASAFNSGFKEGEEQKMTLMEDDANVSDTMINHAYTETYLFPQNDRSDSRYHHTELIKLFCLAEKYAVDKLKKGLVS